ncbi:MAG: hypothetical protein IPQ05_13895 [Leptospiraceae bacterium]|nr:hypothetical protein [Leptospiraceae bacterium]
MDNNDLIIKEYTNKIDPNDKKVSSVNYSLRKCFIINLRQKQWNSSFIKRVSITPTNLEKTEFKEFPDDPDLAKFEPDDKKFIAVACQFQKENLGIKSPVVEAADTDFLHYKDVLKKHVVEIEFICPDMIQEFKRRKDEKNIKGKTKIINRKKKK